MIRDSDRLIVPLKQPGHGLATCAIVPADPAVVLDVKPGEIRDLGDRVELAVVPMCE